MTQDLNLKAMERRAWRSVFQDGLWDIYLGIILTSFAVSAWLDKQPINDDLRMAIYIAVMVFAMLVLYLGKRFITIPRMGWVRFGAERQKRRNLVRLILFISVLFGLVVWLISDSISGEKASVFAGKWVFPLIWVLNMVLVFGLGAYFLDYDRLYVIGFLYALTIPLDLAVKSIIGIDMDVYIFLTAGLIVVGMGIVVLAGFLHDYKPLDLGAS